MGGKRRFAVRVAGTGGFTGRFPFQSKLMTGFLKALLATFANFF